MRSNYKGNTFTASFVDSRHVNYGFRPPGQSEDGDGCSVGFMPWGWGCGESGETDGDGAEDLEGDGPAC